MAIAREREPATPSSGGLDLGAGPEHLTPRELDDLRELAQGHTNNEISEHMGMRPKTVMHHSVSIYSKLGVRGRAEATAWALRNRLMAGEEGR